MILDIHTHHAAPQPEGIISIPPANAAEDIARFPNQLYSVGIHPWSLVADEPTLQDWETLSAVVEKPEVVAIGETGIDLLKGGPLFRQLNVFKHHVELSEKVGKPLIIHCVRAHDQIAQLRREFAPTQPWIVHGFRGKPTVADILLRAGISLSFGPLFNAATVVGVPEDRLFAETDEADVCIEDVIAALAAARGVPPDTLSGILGRNIEKMLTKKD